MIGFKAFASCTNLRNFDFTNVKVIENSAFSGCTKLGFAEKTVVLPATIESVGRNAFSGCTSIFKLEIGYSVIEEFTFSGCSSLKVLTLTGAGQIKNGAFINCSSLETSGVTGLTGYKHDYAFDWETEPAEA